MIELPLLHPTRRALIARNIHTAGDLLRVRDRDPRLNSAAIAAIRSWRNMLPL